MFLSDFINLNEKLKRKLYLLPNINKMLLKWEGLQYDISLDLIWGIIISDLAKTQVTCVQIFSLWKNIVFNNYQWKLPTHHKVSNRERVIYFTDLNLFVCT